LQAGVEAAAASIEAAVTSAQQQQPQTQQLPAPAVAAPKADVKVAPSKSDDDLLTFSDEEL
jgi:hypothetical protein